MWLGSSAHVRAACSMLAERLVCEACQGILGLTKGNVPAFIGVQLFEDGGRKLILLPFREAASGLECFSESVSHRVPLEVLKVPITLTSS
jgi:hypothetical protein